MRKALEEVCSSFHCCCFYCCFVLFILAGLGWGHCREVMGGWRNLNLQMKEIHELAGSRNYFHCCFNLQAEEEMRQRVALIAKIRAIESVPVIRFKVFHLYCCHSNNIN